MESQNIAGWGLYKRLLGYLKPYWYAFVFAAIGNIIFAAVDSYSTYLFKPLLDKGFIDKNYHFLHILPLIIIGLFFARGIGSFLSTYFMGWMGRRLVFQFRQKLFHHMMHLPASYFDQAASGHLLAKLTYNIDQITSATGNSLTTFVRQGCFLIGLITVMFVTNWRLTLIVFVVLPIMVVLVRYVTQRFRKLSRRIQNAIGDVTNVAEESIVGYREIRIFGAQEQQISLFDKLIHYNFRQEMKIIVTDALSSPVIQFICAIVLGFVIYYAVGRGHHVMSAGSFVAMMGAMLAAFKPIRSLSQVNGDIQKGMAAAESVFDLIDAPAEVDHGTKTIGPVKGDIAFNKVSFRYDTGNEWVLKDVDFNIKQGQSVALVGPSGGGKSTIVSLLARFYQPTKGQIIIDGQNIADVKNTALRDQIAIVSQHVTLFDDTLFNNIAFGCNRGASPEAVIEAAKAANAWGFIQELPQGLDTRIGENGLNLSGGQRQRVAIARAVLKDAPILILDEATSALDNESERMVQQALERLQKNRTTLVIAHRLSTIENADEIIVLKEGQIVECGNHKQLMQHDGLYAQLHRASAF